MYKVDSEEIWNLEQMKNREKILKIRLSDEEEKRIISKQKKTYLTKSEYCRRILLGESETIFSKEYLAIKEDVRAEIRMISLNINQIAKAINGMIKNDKVVAFTPVQQRMIKDVLEIIKRWDNMKGRLV